jgi:hypothetical protein
MTASLANRVLENGVWRYLDQDDAEFVLFSEPEYSIEAVDDFVDGRGGVTIPKETISLLRGMRHDAFQAFKSKNVRLMEAHLRGLHMACRAAGMLDAANRGRKYSNEQRERGAKGLESRWRGEDRDNLTEILERLARRQIYGEYETPAELWPRLLGDLDEAGAEPVDKNINDLMNASVIYGADRNELTYEAFRKRIGRIRGGT